MHDVRDPATVKAMERLINEHAWLIDHGRAGDVAALYTGGARTFGIGPDKAGLAEITQWAVQRAAMIGRRSRHVQSTIRLWPMPDGRVGGPVLLTLCRYDGDGAVPGAAVMVAEYGDVCELDGGVDWRFAERRFTVLFGG